VAQTICLYTNLTNYVSPPKVACPLEPPLADENKSDESISHLRAAAGVFADVPADGIRLYLCK